MGDGLDDRAPLILTARLDPASFAFFDEMRCRHFPPALNIVPAHLTLFHKLPGSEIAGIVDLLTRTCQVQPVIPMVVAGLQLLGRGVAYHIKAPPLSALRETLAGVWHEWLTLQDQQGFRPHVVIQNKAPFEDARRLCEELSVRFTPWNATATGLTLWHYRNGPWEKVTDVPFNVDEGT